MSSSGIFSVSREHLKEKAFHALFSLRRHTNLSKLKAALACKIFDTMISPILTYNSEIWGVYAKPDFKTWDGSQIEKAHLQFCKRYLEVNNKASNIACRAELGRFPLNITINQKILKCILYILYSLKVRNLSSNKLFKVTRPSFSGGYHPTLKLSVIPTFTFIVGLTHRMDNI